LKNKKGGTRNLVKNLQEYNTFWSWLTGKLGKLSGLDPEVVADINKSKADLKFYQESMTNLDENRINFYRSVEEFEESKRKAEEENRRIDLLPFLQRPFTRRPALPKSVTNSDSDLEKKLKELWLSQRDEYREIKELQNQLENLQTTREQLNIDMLNEKYRNMHRMMSREPEIYEMNDKLKITKINDEEEFNLLYNDDEIKEYNNYIDEISTKAGAQTKIINLKSIIKNRLDTCKEAEKKVFNKNKVRTKYILFFNYIISNEYIGKEYVDTFLKLCENRIKEQYILSINDKAKTNALREERVTFAETVMTTKYQKYSAENIVGKSDYGEYRVSQEKFDEQVKSCKATLLDILTDNFEIYSLTIRSTFETKSENAKTELDIINNTYENNVLFSKIREKITNISVSGGVLFLNSYGTNPFSQIYQQVLSSQYLSAYPYLSAVISTFVYNILTTIVDNPVTIVPTMDSFYLYLQLIIVVFITPNLLKTWGPVSMDNKAINTFIMGIQLIIILSFLTILLSGFDPSKSEYFSYAPAQVSNSTFSFLSPTNSMTQVWNLIKELPAMTGNNVILYPSYLLRDLILKNGKTIIGMESYALLGFSVTGLFTNFKSLSLEKKRIFKETELQLQKYVFNEGDLTDLLNKFIDIIKREGGIEDKDEYLKGLSDFMKLINENVLVGAQLLQANIMAESVMEQRIQTNIMQAKQKMKENNQKEMVKHPQMMIRL
jgi:hypothetical protein